MTSSSVFIEAAYWLPLLAAMTAALVLAALSMTRRYLIWFAGIALVLALVSASFPATAAPFGARTTLALLCIAVAIIGGSPAVMMTLGIAGGENHEGSHGGIMLRGHPATTNSTNDAGQEVLRGGSTIGVLERLAAAAAILAGHPEALAVIVALKGLGRFSELTASEARERFIIGSMMSLIWACASAAVFLLAAA